MKKLHIRHNGNRCYLSDVISEQLEEQLVNRFSYIDIMDLNKSKYLYSEGGLYPGIADEINHELKIRGYESSVLWQPIIKVANWRLDKGIKLREWQQLVHDKIVKEQVRFGTIQASPGAGKSLSAINEICYYGAKSIFITERVDPFNQAYDTAVKFSNINTGRLGNGIDDIKDFTVVMRQTLCNRLDDPEIKEWLKTVEVVITDESHHSAANQYQAIYDNIKNIKAHYSYSATPWRDDDKNIMLKAFGGQIIYEENYGKNIESETLVPATLYLYYVTPKKYDFLQHHKAIDEKSRSNWQKVKEQLAIRENYQSVYTDYIINNKERNAIAIEFADELNESGDSCVLIVSRIEHAKVLKQMDPSLTVITGQTPKDQRNKILQDLKDHKIMRVVSTLFDEAIDVPSLGGVALMAGGNSSSKLIQRLRCLRSFKGETSKGHMIKTRGYILYPVDRADFLTTHSNNCIRGLRKLMNESEKNEVIEINGK